MNGPNRGAYEYDGGPALDASVVQTRHEPKGGHLQDALAAVCGRRSVSGGVSASVQTRYAFERHTRTAAQRSMACAHAHVAGPDGGPRLAVDHSALRVRLCEPPRRPALTNCTPSHAIFNNMTTVHNRPTHIAIALSGRAHVHDGSF